MHTKPKLIGVLALIGLLLTLMAIWPTRGVDEPQPGVAAVTPDAAPAAFDGGPMSGTANASRVAVEAEAAERAQADDAPESVAVVRGRLLDCRGRPLPDVAVELCAFDLRAGRTGAGLPGGARSASNGSFELVTTPGRVVAPVAAGAGYCTLRTTPSWGQDDVQIVVVAAPAAAITGRVLDTDGLPLADVQVHVMTLFLAEFPLPLDDAVDVQRSKVVTSGRDGRFECENAPLAPGIDLLFTRTGYRSERTPVMRGADGFVEVTLEKLAAVPGKITGVVLDAAGRAVEGAELRLGRDQRTESAANGAFEFEYPERPRELLATCPGLLPVVRSGIGEETPMPLLVEFGGASLEITGRVVGPDGRGVPELLVNLVDPEPTATRALIESQSSPDLEGLPKGALGRTDDAGRFAVGGLLDREYRLRAWDPKSALSVQSEPVRAGSRGIELHVPKNAFFDEVKGIVVDGANRPVAEACVSAYLLASSQGGFVRATVPLTLTGSDGRFTLRDVPRRHVHLTVTGDGLVYTKRAIEDCAAQRDVRIEVQRLLHVQLEGEVGLAVRFLDAAGSALFVKVSSRHTAFSTNAWRMRAAKSPILQVPETAVTMIWSRGGEEIGRQAIVLSPDAAGDDHVVPLVLGR